MQSTGASPRRRRASGCSNSVLGPAVDVWCWSSARWLPRRAPAAPPCHAALGSPSGARARLALCSAAAFYLDALPAGVSRPAAGAVFDTLVRPAHRGTRRGGARRGRRAGGLAERPGRWAVAVRDAWTGGIGSVRRPLTAGYVIAPRSGRWPRSAAVPRARIPQRGASLRVEKRMTASAHTAHTADPATTAPVG